MTVSNAVAMQTMQMQPGVTAAPRLRPTSMRASWSAVQASQASCTHAFGTTGLGSFLGHTTDEHLIDLPFATAVTIAVKANPAYGHRQPEESST